MLLSFVIFNFASEKADKAALDSDNKCKNGDNHYVNFYGIEYYDEIFDAIFFIKNLSKYQNLCTTNSRQPKVTIGWDDCTIDKKTIILIELLIHNEEGKCQFWIDNKLALKYPWIAPKGEYGLYIRLPRNSKGQFTIKHHQCQISK